MSILSHANTLRDLAEFSESQMKTSISEIHVHIFKHCVKELKERIQIENLFAKWRMTFKKALKHSLIKNYHYRELFSYLWTEHRTPEFSRTGFEAFPLDSTYAYISKVHPEFMRGELSLALDSADLTLI